MKPGNTGITRIIKAAGYSFNGMLAAWKHEAAFRQESILVAVLTFIALILPVDYLDKVLMIAALLIVLIVELLNSAVESVVDRIGDEYHELSGRAKDMGSAAVFISLVLVALVWGSVLVKWYWMD